MTDLVKRLREFSTVRAFSQGALFSEAAHRIEELEEESRFKGQMCDDWRERSDSIEAELNELQRKHKALVDGVKPHIADLERTADRIEAWQDPNVGPFDATIAEIRKAAHELRALLEDGDD